MCENSTIVSSIHAEKGRFQKALFCLIALLIGVFLFYAPVAHAEAGPIAPEKEEEPYYVKLKTTTPLHGGDVIETLRTDLYPKVRELATGKVPNDKLTWKFEDALLYAEDSDELEATSNLEGRFAPFYIREPGIIANAVGEDAIGVFDIDYLGWTVETRKVKNASGKEVYRCALTELYVKRWCSPYGPVCSRDEALGYYNKYQKQVELVISKLKAKKSLSIEKKLKWIHDWLSNSTDYDYDGLDEHYKELYDGIAAGTSKYQYLYNEYGAIIEGKTVCKGYALGFKALVDELVRQTGAKIECEVVSTSDHAWNRVKFNGKWYHIDVTFDDDEDDLFKANISTKYFLVSDNTLAKREHPGGDGYKTNRPEKATDRKYESQSWPRYKKDLSEYTVELKEPDKVYAYTGKTVVPSVVVKYGRNILPAKAYKVKRTDKNKSGTGSIKIVPASGCYAISGSKKGPNFKLSNNKITGTAKSTVVYKLDESGTAIRPFDNEFQPFASTYKYSKQPAAAKSADKALTLKQGVDYTVTYSRNKKAGWATATIKMKGSYSGKVKVKYQIAKNEISGTAESTKEYQLGKSKKICPFDKTFKPFESIYKYTKQSTSMTPSESLTLKKGTDYTVKYSDNKKVGLATATITLKGNYTGKITVKYKITE